MLASTGPVLAAEPNSNEPLGSASEGQPAPGHVRAAGGGSGTVTNLDRFHKQKLRWRDCGQAQCARVKVPLSYSHTTGPTIRIGIARQKTAKKGSKALLFNPGGPGGSGTDFVANGEIAGIVPQAVSDKYDVVGFDPRGLNRSTQLNCVSKRQLEKRPANPPITKAEGRIFAKKVQRIGKWCWQADAALTAHLGTQNAARDLDIVREALRQKRLSYFGISYGTYLGTVYAAQFPRKVGRFLLDAGLSPTVDTTGWAKAQARGMQKALKLFAKSCRRDGCPIPGKAIAIVAAINDLLAQLHRQPLPVPGSDLPVGNGELLNILTTALPSTANWPIISVAIESVSNNDGATVRQISEAFSPAANVISVNLAVNCYDRPTPGSTQSARANAKAWQAFSETFARTFAWQIDCGKWPVRNGEDIEPIRSTTNRKVLLIGGLNDPLTPFKWTKELAGLYPHGRVLTWTGIGHGATTAEDRCVDRHVSRYFKKGSLPPSGAAC